MARTERTGELRGNFWRIQYDLRARYLAALTEVIDKLEAGQAQDAEKIAREAIDNDVLREWHDAGRPWTEAMVAHG